MDPFTQLIDYFIKLTEVRNKRKDKYYQEIVKGCYECSGHVKDDLLRIFSANEHEIREGKPLNHIAHNVIQERYKEKSKRDFLRATLAGVDKDDFSDFEKGIETLLQGEIDHALKNNFRQLMYLHQEIMETKHLNDPYQKRRKKSYIHDALEINGRSIALVNIAWEKINQGYSKHLKEYLNT